MRGRIGNLRVRLGNEILLGDPRRVIGERRVGLIVNHSSFTPDMRFLPAELLRAGIRVTAILGPEHGFAGAAQDMVAIDGRALWNGIPVFSLYGSTVDSLSPPPEALGLVDALVFDIQDVGSRYYTFVWTLALAMRAASAAGKAVVVCDRPNPLGGRVVSGPGLEPGFESFVGLYPVPIRHGMTAGEIARHVRRAHGIDVDLHVIAMDGWTREMWWDGTGLPWIPPSPNMPTPNTAVVYPGGCLIEATDLSEGRGTTTPFEIVGAPGIDGDKLAQSLCERELNGCVPRPVTFEPRFQKHANRPCGGVFIHVTDREAFDGIRTFAHLIDVVHREFPRVFAWRGEAYEFVRDIPAIDLLAGSPRLRRAIESGGDIDDALNDGFASRFRAMRDEDLLYP
ncbi:MAG: DUF1343 domain-containing protein [Deltaproteobacteria bacterium]|nr:DUF1343 domain-containing protein [Deltaproteobacteria bacterium]